MTTGLRTFDGGVAIITGGASGIGRALGTELANRGCHVVLADLDLEPASEVADAIKARGQRATAVKLDVADCAAVTRLVNETAEEHGRLDYIFNNAGIAAAGMIRDHTIEAWDRVIDVNLKGVVYGVQAAYPIMLAQGFGHIVNTASMAGLVASVVGGSYAATKHAVVGLSKSLRAEAGADGIRVSVLCPGVIRTSILGGGSHGIMLDVEELKGATDEDRRRVMLDGFERTRPMDPTDFATKALDQVAANKAIIVVPTWWKLMWWLERLSPTLSLALTSRMTEQLKKEFATPKAAVGAKWPPRPKP